MTKTQEATNTLTEYKKVKKKKNHIKNMNKNYNSMSFILK